MKLLRNCTLAALATVAAGNYVVDMSGVDKKFEGIGALSGGGATSRLLVDYKEPQRSQILDYLFLPKFAASLQVLKVEIGGDSQSTDGLEHSHMHSKDDLDLTRGYEWWLMKEAKKRNPDIKLYGLPWAFPGWVGDDPATGVPSGSPFKYPNQTSTYLTTWVKGAKEVHNLTIDYIGVWNERSSSAAYTTSLKQMLASEGFGNVKIVAKDGDAGICNDLANDPAYNASVDIIGLHYPTDYANYSVCHSLNKPFWASEESSAYDDYNGAACWARVINSHYVLSGMTSSIMWNLVGSYYHGTLWYASSMLTAVQPWSGYTENLYAIWATAHVTQFTEYGWRYLKPGSGSGVLSNGGFYTTLTSPDSADFTIVIAKISHEHAQCARPTLPDVNVTAEEVVFVLNDNMKSPNRLHFWRSNFEEEKKIEFEEQADVTVENNIVRVKVSVGDVITLSTISDAKKGHYPSVKSEPQFPLPHNDDFESKPISQEAPLCSDQIGAFETHLETGNSSNKVMRQMVPATPIRWGNHAYNGAMTLIGMKEWQDITVSIDVKVPLNNASGCIATRVNREWVNGVVYCITGSGNWSLAYTGPPPPIGVYNTTVANGTVRQPGIGKWFTMSLTTINNSAVMKYNNEVVASIPIRNIDYGFAAFGTNLWYHVEYDNLHISKAGDNWSPTSTCKKAQIGTPITSKPCTSNGLSTLDEVFFLNSNYQIVHVDSGLCVEFSNNTLALQPCVYKSTAQRFNYGYTLIRRQPVPITLNYTNLRLVGAPDLAQVSSETPKGGWNSWCYFPNTQQLRNQHDVEPNLGYPMCLSACE